VVLLPYAQLLPLATRFWAMRFPQGFAPRFETSQSWSRSLGGVPFAAHDIRFDIAQDVLTARSLLEQAGQGAMADTLVTRLLEAALELAPIAAATAPAQRLAWAARTRAVVQSGLDSPVLRLEATVAQLAVAWAADSAYATDILFEARAKQACECLLVLRGLQAEPLLDSLSALWGEQSLAIDMDDSTAEVAKASFDHVAFHTADDSEQEAQLAAACVLQHVNAGRVPVALVALDRALTRRVRAMLDASGLRLRDENGWKLSTSRSAAHVMASLRACLWDAGTDPVLDWLKNAPAFDTSTVSQLEARLRRAALREWRSGPVLTRPEDAALQPMLARVQSLREGMQASRPLFRWLQALRELLQHSGQLALLQDDAAGEKLSSVLRLDEVAAAQWTLQLADVAWTSRHLSLTEFIHWVNQALEGASFVPPYPANEQVVILPLSQLLARPFEAVVIPGCDEVRLNPAPELTGIWTGAQRLALGLATRETAAQELRAAWAQALRCPQLDVLWRSSDDGGEPLLASALVQRLQSRMPANQPSEPRLLREIIPTPVACPAPSAPQLVVSRLSAGAYEDLRRCPYRFFARHQLGLKETDELESELDKRDFGLWLHAVLKKFHDALKPLLAVAPVDRATRLQLMDQAAAEITQEQHLSQAEFLPFMAAWPQVRDGYLDWLQTHEAIGARFEVAESWQETALGSLTLYGRIDRVDLVARDAQTPAQALVLDYKTEPLATTRQRIKSAYEDTQLAFYAALLPDDRLRAAYVNVGEREGTKLVEQENVVSVRDALLEGIGQEMARIAQGAALPALGEGSACEYCAARGLCRKDFWAMP
jgi:ATP-dependent helicase/nuclease subunit B